MVKIGEYHILVESNCLTLQKHAGQLKNGKDRYSILGYYSRWEHLFDGLLKHMVADKVNQSDIITIQELKQIIIESRKEVRQAATLFDMSEAV